MSYRQVSSESTIHQLVVLKLKRCIKGVVGMVIMQTAEETAFSFLGLNKEACVCVCLCVFFFGYNMVCGVCVCVG